MFVRAQDIRFCLDKAAEIAEQYRLYVLDSNNAKKSLDDLLWICEEYLKLKIFRGVLKNMPASESSIRGLYILLDDSFEIYLLSDMNFCWTRFVLCKELFHGLMDKEEYRNSMIYGHIKEVVEKFPEAQSHPSPAAVSELLAEIAAMEFLYPYRERLTDIAGKTNIDYLAIAEHYKIPQYYVEKYLGEGWIKYLGAFHPTHHQNPPPAAA